MPKLILMFDEDGFWKVVHLNDDLSFGYTAFLAAGSVENFGYVYEAQLLVGTQQNVFRILAYDTNLEPTPLVRMAQGGLQTLYYYDLAEIIPYPVEVMRTPVALIMPPEIYQAALNNWNILVAQTTTQQTIDSMQQYIDYLMQSLQMAQHQVQQLSEDLESVSLHSGSTIRKLNSPTFAEFVAPTSPATLSSFVDQPIKSTEHKIKDKAAKNNAKRLLRQLQQQRNFEVTKIQLRELLQGIVKSYEVFNFLQKNTFINNTSFGIITDLLREANLPAKICVECLQLQHQAHTKLKNDKLDDKTVRALLQTLIKYKDSELTPLKIEIPQTIVALSADLRKNTAVNDIAELTELHKAVISLQLKFAPTTKIKPVKEESDTISPSSPMFAAKASKPTVTFPLKPIDKFRAAINNNDAQEFNKLMAEKANREIDSEIAAAFLNSHTLQTESGLNFLQACTISNSMYHALLSDIHKMNMNLESNFIKKLISLPNEELILILQEFKDNRGVQDFFDNKLSKHGALKIEYEQKFTSAKGQILALLAEKIRQNKRGILADLQKYSMVCADPVSGNETLLMLALKNNLVPREVVSFLIGKSYYEDLLNVDQTKQSIFHLWAEYRPNDMQIFVELFRPYAFAIQSWHDPKLKNPNIAHEVIKKLKNNEGKTFLHIWLNSKKNTVNNINALLTRLMYSDSLIAMVTFIKDAAGYNAYTQLEQRILDSNPAEFELEFAKLEDTLFHVLREVQNQLIHDQNPKYESEILDFFNNANPKNIFIKLLESLPDTRAAARLKILFKFRNKLRGDIDKNGEKLRPYFGLHDIFDIALHLFENGSQESNTKAVEYINKWLALGDANNLENGSLLYATIYALRNFSVNRNQTAQYQAAIKILQAIVAAKPEILSKLPEGITKMLQGNTLKEKANPSNMKLR